MHNVKSKVPVRIALFAALIAVCSMISIPFTVPMTLQIFAIFFALMTIRSCGLIAICVYIAIGIVGLPVFAGFGAGVGHILGASGGVILGFIPAGGLFLLLGALFGKGRIKEIFWAFVSLLLIYAIGVLWFVFVYGSKTGIMAAITLTVLPNIIPDAVKILLASYLSVRMKKMI